jgi:hypothetical protein
MFEKVTINDVIKALDALKDIKRPYDDNNDYSINSERIIQGLNSEERGNDIALIDDAENKIKSYVKQHYKDDVDSIGHLSANLNKKEYSNDLSIEDDNIVGSITIPKRNEEDEDACEWKLSFIPDF